MAETVKGSKSDRCWLSRPSATSLCRVKYDVYLCPLPPSNRCGCNGLFSNLYIGYIGCCRTGTTVLLVYLVTGTMVLTVFLETRTTVVTVFVVTGTAVLTVYLVTGTTVVTFYLVTSATVLSVCFVTGTTVVTVTQK